MAEPPRPGPRLVFVNSNILTLSSTPDTALKMTHPMVLDSAPHTLVGHTLCQSVAPQEALDPGSERVPDSRLTTNLQLTFGFPKQGTDHGYSRVECWIATKANPARDDGAGSSSASIGNWATAKQLIAAVPCLDHYYRKQLKVRKITASQFTVRPRKKQNRGPPSPPGVPS
ncbi:uncharacterized protein BJ212DRAFT_1297370 [Suillus subaureus]|uniref:Uncharacterized protein n=1 Tax=Suillus subaureus TaxID=48587 RepID=A0A9P7EG95_9AGAM|nr:uncharacterized protein BJ212DRAFT_1297370 [Suillus subaureus]KAG1820875.1 hypothetical protein BJ212DRAFT_1297370 [Suillus subaureus]